MKLRLISRLQRFFVPALAAFSLTLGMAGCSSDGESEQPEAGIEADGNAVNNEALNNNVAAEEGTNAEGNLSNGTEQVSGENPAGNELQNLVNEGGADSAGQTAATDAPQDPGTDPFANAGATNQAATDPTLAPTNGTEVPANPAFNAPPANALAGTNVAPANEATNGENVANANANAENTENTENSEEGEEEAASAQAGAVPEDGVKMAYYIRSGDTLATIAQKIYGNKVKWKELASQNNLIDADRIYAGDVIYYTVDQKSKEFADSYESAPRKSVTVASGDTLSSIAAKVYGSQSEWRTLWKENPQVRNPDLITSGMVLSFREFSGAATAARNEDEVEENESAEGGELVGAVE